VCEVVTVAKRDLAAGELLDGVGGFTSYGLIDNRQAAREANALPIAMSDDCFLVRSVRKDEVVTFDDVRLPAARLRDKLWAEQQERWPLARPATRSAARPAQLAEIG
jgi:predicted homoserine dehydrogenase-like protein